MTAARALLAAGLPPLAETGHILCVGLRLDGDPEAWIEAAASLVTQSERARARRFLHAADAARHLAGRALARRMLRSVPGLGDLDEFDLSPLGKPLCPPAHHGANIGFSISHSGATVWTAFRHGGEVGIDVEALRPLPDVLDLAGQLHPQECAEIRALPEGERAAAFLRCWTRKEAVLKALGQGLSQPLQSFRVTAKPGGAGWSVAGAGVAGEGAAGEGWTCRDIDTGPEYLCAVAASAPGLSLSAHVVEG